MPMLVLDEQLCRGRLIDALQLRGYDVGTVKDFGAKGRPDPDVVRRIDEGHHGAWVLITMDLTIVEDFRGFDWDRYAIAWVVPHEHLKGAAFEHEKNDIVHRHVHRMLEQGRGDHHTYTVKQRHKSRPSLMSQLRRRL
jgi:hypothetical protein